MLLHLSKTSRTRCRAVALQLAFGALWIGIATMMGADESFAQSWKQGRTLLMSGKYPGAEASLTQAYKTSKSAQEKAETLKFLGVAQYMQKKEAQASSTFRAALKINPRLKLQDSEVADESVLPFFEKQRGSGAQTAAAKTLPKPPVTLPKPPGGGMARGSGAPANNVKKSKKTLVRVNCNVPSAQISVDGISYGTAGSDIEIKPGEVVLEITAQGYIKKAVKINVAPLTANVLTVNLDKPQPKQKAVANTRSGTLPLPSTGGTGNAKAKKAGGSKGAGDLFGAEPGSPDDFSTAPSLAPPSAAAQAQAIAPPAAPGQPLLPQGAYAQPMYGAPQQPMYQQPMYQQPMYQQPMYQQPMYQQPMYQQPMYQQPMYQQPQYPSPYPAPPAAGPPSVYNPGGAYQPPPYDPGYAAPPIEPAPPSAGLPPIADNPIDPGMPPPMKVPPGGSGSKKKVADGRKSSGCSPVIKILPFGAGQFCQGSPMKGVLFLGAQVGAIYFWKQNSDAATKFQTQLDTVIQERADNRPATADTDGGVYDQETTDKETAGKATIAKANQNAQLSLAVFGGAWALGVVDAFVFPPSSAKSKKTIKRARLSLQLDTDFDHSQKPTLAFLSPLSIDVGQDAIWYAGYSIPVAAQERGGVKLGVTWDL